MYRLVVCDNDMQFSRALESLLYSISDTLPYNISIDRFTSGEELITALKRENTRYDIIFITYEIAPDNGMETGKKIRGELKEWVPEIVFISAYSSIAPKVMPLKPFGFLRKPIDQGRLREVLTDCVQEIKNRDDIYTIIFNKELYRLSKTDILYFESEKRYKRAVTFKETVKFSGSMKEIIEAFENDSFARIHLSYFINLEHITRIKEESIIMANGDELPLSRNYEAAFWRMCSDHLGGRI